MRVTRDEIDSLALLLALVRKTEDPGSELAQAAELASAALLDLAEALPLANDSAVELNLHTAALRIVRPEE
jgi:hypothetical protein